MGGVLSTPSTPSTSPFCGPRTRTTMDMIPSRIARLRPNHSSRGTLGNSRSRRPTSGAFASRRKASPELIVGCVSRTPAPRLLSAPESAGYLLANVCPVELLSLVPQNLRGTIARGKEAGGAPSRPALAPRVPATGAFFYRARGTSTCIEKRGSLLMEREPPALATNLTDRKSVV